MDSSEGSHIPSATLDYDNGEGEYKPMFEWIFSDGIDNICLLYTSLLLNCLPYAYPLLLVYLNHHR